MVTNALVTVPRYSNPVMSILHLNNILDSIDDDQISELDGFEDPYTYVSYGHGVPPEGTCKLLGPYTSVCF